MVGCKENSEAMTGIQPALEQSCNELNGEFKTYEDSVSSYQLCHFKDGTFCASELLSAQTCEPGKWPYKPSISDAIQEH